MNATTQRCDPDHDLKLKFKNPSYLTPTIKIHFHLTETLIESAYLRNLSGEAIRVFRSSGCCTRVRIKAVHISSGR